MALSWVLEDVPTPAVRSEATWGTVSALASAALAETLLTPPVYRHLFLAAFLNIFAYAVVLLLFRQVVGLFRTAPASMDWWTRGAWVLLPLHFLLAAALIAAPFGWAGMIFYEIVKLGVALALLHRLIAMIQILLAWPAWAATLLAATPFLVALLGILLMAGLTVIAAGLAAWTLLV